MRRLISAAMLLVLTACGPFAVSFAPAERSHLEIGKTTYDQAVAQLGTPTDTGALADGGRLATYVYMVQGQPQKFQAGAMPMVQSFSGQGTGARSAFELRFDHNGVLQSYDWKPAP